MSVGTIFFLLAFVLFWCIGTEAINSSCVSLRYIEIGTTATINCFFQANFTSLQWYDPTDPLHRNVTLIVQGVVKKGRGLLSGEFDISDNGSLIINNVTLKHEGTFTALLVQTPTSKVMSFDIDVFVFGPSFSRMPYIVDCSDTNRICFQTWDQRSNVSCIIEDTRPAVPLSWLVRTKQGDQNVSSHFSVQYKKNSFFTSSATTIDPFTHSSFLTLLACIADGQPGLLERNESLVLLQIGEEMMPIVAPVKTYVEIGSKLEMNCSGSPMVFLAWQTMNASERIYECIGFAVLIGKQFKRNNAEYNLNDAGSLVVNTVRTQHEGIYRCISGDGFEDNILIYDVVVYSSPIPAYLIVDGCQSPQDCVLETQPEGNLTCTVKRIFPKVELVFKSLSDKSVIFYENKLTVKENEDAFDVILTSKYSVKDVTKTIVSIECALNESDLKIFNMSTKLDLRIIRGLTSNKRRFYWSFATLILPVLLLAGIYTLCKVNSSTGCHGAPARQQQPGEDISMLSRSKQLEDEFIFHLIARYEGLYGAVKPIPYFNDRHCVSKVFVDSRIEYLDPSETIGGQGTWKRLDSYRCILNNLHGNSCRCIVEAEPGYGKSTLTLQLAYDWCSDVKDSAQEKKSILILLRLRQLTDVSIYSAIKQLLLPKDTKLSETDIENIMCEEGRSVLLVMDGFDEYSHQLVKADSHIINIIARRRCEKFNVILTTRTSNLPNNPPPFTKRIRLTGFDEQARDQYIKKFFVDSDADKARMLKEKLNHTLIKNLCEVPLFFVMFAHMIFKNIEFQKFTSVTSCVQFMMECCYNHMKNKIEDESVGAYALSVTNQIELEEDALKLEEVAFDGLIKENQQTTWKKEELLELLGQDIYLQYVRIGILVEEEDFDLFRNITKVRFFHTIFCEWFAAQRFAKHASTIDTENLKYLDPFRFQYFYRFACGINDIAAEKIIDYLREKFVADADMFPILCILEQGRKVENMRQIQETLCSHEVRIENDYSRLLQNSITQFLENASSCRISITKIWLYDCYSKVDLSSKRMQLKSNIFLPVLATLKELWIQETGGENMTRELTDILQYSCMCQELKKLRFFDCLLPHSVQTETLPDLNSRNFKVIWQPCGFLEDEYRLNLVSGKWESTVDNVVCVMTDGDYQNEIKKFRIRYRRQETVQACLVTEDDNM